MAGRQLASAARSGREMTVIGYIDDNPDLAGRTIDAYPVFSMPEVAEVVASRRITHIMLAVPSVGRRRRAEIIESLKSLPVKVQSLPGVMDLAHGKVRSEEQTSELQSLMRNSYAVF